jgi:hypothetical protein
VSGSTPSNRLAGPSDNQSRVVELRAEFAT